MEDAADPLPWIFLSLLQPLSVGVVLGLLVMVVLLICSALISGTEVAFFALTPQDRKELEESNSKLSDLILKLLEKPKKLLATVLIGNNFVNVAIVIISTFIMDRAFAFGDNAVLAFVIQIVAVTLLILLLGEIIPKVYANRYSLRWVALMARPIAFLSRVVSPLSHWLIQSTSLIDRKAEQNASNNISVDELSHALELTTEEIVDKEEQKMLEGIVRFGSTDVKQIMTPRTDVVAFDLQTDYASLTESILEAGYSRIPVYEGSLDKVSGILYVKDLLPHLGQSAVDWQALIRPPLFVPENKKIDDLLKEFQERKLHVAVVVDEYGGSSGIVTLEDIIEEIVGDIADEFDDDDLTYSKLDAHNYIFEGKTPLIDLYRVLKIDGEDFEAAKGESDTLAGFLLEMAGKIPKKNEKVQFERYTFIVEAADKRKIKRVKITINEDGADKKSKKAKKERNDS